MFPLFETIRLVDGLPLHLAYHNARANSSRRTILGSRRDIDLADALRAIGPIGPGILRCRVPYGEVAGTPEVRPYVPRQAASLLVVPADGLLYAHKFADRSAIDALMSAASGRADDILMVRRGLVTDASAANVAFFDGESWITPAEPLLHGTARERLLDEGSIVTGEIRVEDILPGSAAGDRAGAARRYRAAALFSALVDFNSAAAIPADRLIAA